MVDRSRFLATSTLYWIWEDYIAKRQYREIRVLIGSVYLSDLFTTLLGGECHQWLIGSKWLAPFGTTTSIWKPSNMLGPQ